MTFSSMRQLIIAPVIASILAGCGFYGADLKHADIKNRVYDRVPTEIKTEFLLTGPEDITVSWIGGVPKYAYISATDRRELDPDKSGIFRYDLGKNLLTKMKISGVKEKPFYPHGISLLTKAQCEKEARLREISGENSCGGIGKQGLLFVITHPNDTIKKNDEVIQSQVHAFSINNNKENNNPDGTLTAVSVNLADHPANSMRLNDLVAVGPDRYYATANHRTDTFVGKLRLLFGSIFPSGKVFQCDSGQCEPLEDRYAFANGINVSHDHKKLYIADAFSGALHSFKRLSPNGLVELKPAVKLSFGPDNIEMSCDGKMMFIGGHSSLIDFTIYGDKANKPSGSVAVMLSTEGKGGLRDQGENNQNFRTLVSDGDLQYPAISVVAPVGDDRILIGNVYDKGFWDSRKNISDFQKTSCSRK